VEDEGGRAGAAGALEGVKLEVDLGEAGGEDGGAHVVFPAQPHAPRQEVVPGRLHKHKVKQVKNGIFSMGEWLLD